MTGYFWNIIIAVEGLLERLYFYFTLLFTIVLTILLASYSWILASILIGYTTIFFFVSRGLVNEICTWNKQYIIDSNTFSSIFESAIRTTLDIKVFQKTEAAKERFKKGMLNYFESAKVISEKETIVYTIMEITRILMIISYFIVYIQQYMRGNLNILTALGSGVYVLYIATGGLSSVFTSYLEYMKSKDAIEYIEKKNNFQSKPEKEMFFLKTEKIEHFSLHDISYSINENPLFKGVTCTFEAGKTYCLTGANGSGKSTLIKLICGLAENQSGYFKINNESKFLDLSNTNILDSISLYSTEMEVYHQTIKNNVFYNCFEHVDLFESKIIKHKGEMGLDLPDTYVINSSGTNLSQGQKQKLLLLRTLNSEKDIYIFDEPTGNLDKRSEGHFIKIVKNIAKEGKKTIIIISHNKNVVESCDFVINFESREESEL